MFFDKKLSAILIFALFLIIVPASFAMDDDVVLSVNETCDNDILEVDYESDLVSGSQNQDILSASNDYYFDASAENDSGDGSSAHPYKYLNADRIKGNANIYLANGEYNLDARKTIEQVRIYGDDPSRTVIKYDGVAFNVNSYLALTNVTLMDLSITNSGIVNLTNVFFNNGYGSSSDSYGNNYGGAIYTTDTNRNAQVNIVNSTFTDNYAVYGGAIYMAAGSLYIADSEFVNNRAYNFGGAIACENVANVTISKSKFIRNVALYDAGGAIYVKFADNFRADNLNITYSEATFGGAMTTLYVNVTLNNIYTYSNAATWDGGAIYHMYGQFSSTYGNFIENSARNGGALFIDNSTSLFIRSNAFTNNTASKTAGAIFSFLNTLTQANSLISFNNFNGNSAANENDVYETQTLNLTIGNGEYSLYQIEDVVINTLPSYYNLVRQGYTTTVKDQQSSGNCWAFTAIAVLESCLKKITGKEFDLSEENMKNVIALFSDYGWKMETNEGGFDVMPFGYFASWLGPVLESDDMFDDKSVLSPIINSIMHIQNIAFLKRNSFTDNDEIKSAIMKYGAVGTGIYFDTYYLNQGKNYYCWNTFASNHAVTIVGWDDSYSREHFKFGSYAGGDGAWIVRNSWGPYWGEDGYFYVSYYDSSFAKVGVDEAAYTFILNDTIKFDKNYQYDIAGKTDYLYGLEPEVWYKNKFTATDNEVLYGVSTYFEKLTNWTVSVYVNNALKAIKSGTSNPGYYTINLDEGIDLSLGDVFEVVFNTKTSQDISSVPISEIASLNKLIYSQNISFVSYDGVNWIDLFDYTFTYSTHKYYSQVACIKAFTVVNDLETSLSLDVDYNGYNPVTITATVKDEHDELVRNGVVTFILDGENVTVNVVNGKASIARNFEKGINHVSAVFEGNSYADSANSTSFEVLKDNITLEVSLTKYQGNASLTITASKSVSKKVLIFVNGREDSVKLVNGKAYYRLTNLENGEYNVSISLADESVYESDVVNVSFVVDVKSTTILASEFITTKNSGELYTVTLVDENGNPVSGKKLTFNLNNRKTTAVTDSDGKVSISIKLSTGEYAVDVSFSEDDSYYGSSNSSLIKVKTQIGIVLENETYQNNVLIDISLSNSITVDLDLSINGESQTVHVTRGKATLNLTNLENGEYTVSAYLDDSYIVDCDDLKFTVDVRNTQILVNESIVSEGIVDYTVTLVDDDGSPICGKAIEIRVNDDVYSEITGNDGKAGINLDLEKGTYSVYVSFSGDNNLFSSRNSTQIIIRPSISAAISSEVIGNVANIDVMFSRPINGTASVIVDDKNYTVTLNDGIGSVDLTGLESGIHHVSVELFGDEYNFIKPSANFTITLKETRIMADDFTTTDFSHDLYVVVLIDEDGNPIASQEIAFAINGETVSALTNETGHASIPIDLDAGNYTIVSSYTPTDLKYVGCENTSRIIVKLNATISVSVSKNLREVVVEFNCSKPINDTLTVMINGENKTVRLTDGKGSIALDDLADGDYSISIDLGDKYESEPVEFDFTVKVKQTRIVADDFETYFASGENFQVKLVDEDGLPVAHSLLSVLIDNSKLFMSRTNENGLLLVPINLNEGRHSVEIKFEGDESYLASMASAGIQITSGISFTNAQYCLNSDCIVLLSGNVSGKSVNVSIDGIMYNVIANGNQISLNINLNVGSHSIEVTNPVTGEIKSHSIKVLPRLTDNKNIVMYYGANKVYSVKAYGDNGHSVGAGEVVVINIAGKNYNVKTDSNGIASISLNQFKAKSYTVTATYKGFKVSNKITVKPTLITKNKSVKKGKTIKFTAKLLNSNGKILKNKKITFKFKGKTYKVKTNKKGIATLKMTKKYKAGTYKIISKYGKVKNTNKIKIKK